MKTKDYAHRRDLDWLGCIGSDILIHSETVAEINVVPFLYGFLVHMYVK
jgi:hypothetical protein